MKKLIALALMLILIPALCATGASAAAESGDPTEKYLKYQELLDALEAGNYDEARSMVEQMKPAPEYPPVTEVEITADNFLDYFEYVEIPEYGLVLDRLSSGEPAAIFASSGYFLKDEYPVHPLYTGEVDITADVKYSYWLLQPTTLSIDFDALTYTVEEELNAKSFYHMEKEATLKAYYNDPWLHLNLPTRTALLNDYVNYAPVIIDTVDVLSASGTLYLAG